MPVILFDAGRDGLAPLCRLRPACEIVVGARTILEKWRRRGPVETAVAPGDRGPGLYVDGRALPFDVEEAGPEEAGVLDDGTVVYLRLGAARAARGAAAAEGLPRRRIEARLVRRPWDAVRLQPDELRADLAAEGVSGVRAAGAGVAPSAVLDASEGPVLVEPGGKVGHHAILVGPCRVGPSAIVHPLSYVRGSSIGEGCRVGGEISASTFAAHANKQHLGFVGHSYVAPWVNLGAGTTTSNLKNTYGEIRVEWDGRREGTGLRFLGAIIADHAKVGINASFTTGTIVGVAANLFGAGTFPKEAPDFVWGGPEEGYTECRLEDALRTAGVVLGRRGLSLDDADRRAVSEAFLASAPRRAAWLAEREA